MTLRSLRLVLFVAAILATAAAPGAEIVESRYEPTQREATVLTLVNDGQRRTLSLADIEAVGLHDTELQHFEGLEGRFTGVRLDRFMAEYGLADARRIRFIGADDYTIFLTPDEIRSKNYLLVTRFEGEPLPRDELGPLMLVVPEEEHAVLAGDTAMTNWIWALIEIRAQ